MISYDICLLWNWPQDSDFVALFDATCNCHDLSLLQITPANLHEVMSSLQSGEITFSVLFDRACDQDMRFEPVVRWAREREIFRINCFELARCAWDKAAMHAAVSQRLATPATIVLPSYQEAPDLPPLDVVALGDKLVAKPAHGGGGAGVVTGITSSCQAVEARRAFPADKYLLQSQIAPARLGQRPGWFRVLYCTGYTYAFWWDPASHVYTLITDADESRHGLAPLHRVADDIAGICHLDLFSTEIALTPARFFVVVDYVNDPVDLRLQSRTPDGVPDCIVVDIARRLAELVVRVRAP